ncbi:iron export ABC transporter permease subunit FetB [Planktothrix sp. FACHB-1355]|uniref:Iron export ABC transporter permease subunit FetB n=1 Tax=Aerosakkonema funiforme FACHB-1375 TaxID=2949571 RepID=A0A926VCX8_9CYAN|nr:iron export ABC transporter permease subunit FetB [Aerosakkonema funiforme]MBD2181083.1 iron export ABC transporter permease subunit FetB [Aerosakkonema funiforme FACHB-1375]MBD3561952.1 iron export ABC transporter permease subunit FetB [Planktothrix sp. FACHB-1355]
MDLAKFDPTNFTWALGLIAFAIGLSAWEKLGLEWPLAIATGRTILQLLGVGFVLEVVFAQPNPVLVIAVLFVMLIIATRVAKSRIGEKIPQMLPVVGGSLLLSTALTLVYVNFLVIKPQIWYEPQFLIPFAGIVLGNAMNGAALAGERLVSSLKSTRLEIETHLSLGATPAQAVAQYKKEAIKAAMIPNLNTMTVVGLVTLPGTFTGQILGGVSPFIAAFYQMLILVMQASATLITAFLITQGICRQVFNSDAQLKI